jgi:type II secretory pathway pseudopilin PulG
MKRVFTPLQTISRRKRNRVFVTGFTLVEIMIVVAIVIILVSLATPNILRSRVNANEGAAIANLRSINSACQLYHIDREAYPGSLSDLIEPNSSPAYIDPTLASGRKQGYEFIYSLFNDDHFTVNANPTTRGLLQGRYFYMDETGIIRAKSGDPAGHDDEIIG